MSEWKTYRLGDLCSRIKSGKGIPASEVSTTGEYPVIGGNGIRGYTNTSNFNGVCAVVGRQGAYCGNVRFFSGEAYMTEHAVVIVGNELADTRYLAYLLSIMQLGHLSAQSAQPGLSVQTLSKLSINIPDISTQRRIAGILGSLDDKIELNRRINANLEAQAQALFRSWFVGNDKQLGNYQTKSLTDIAQYLNGLAMQKFPPESIQNSLPVLKIKELGQGLCDASSDRCSTSIKPEYVINDGDVIFSWSGTLLVDVWCGGKCGLNQHLFKVTSDNYPKWFIFYWTKHHLDKFIRIAKDKAVTMGHIKRCDLESSEVKVPEKPILEYLDKIFTPLFDSMIAHRIENRKLSALRDTLLPKLMAGEI